MEQMQKQGLLYGCSITVTTENLKEVLSDEFAASLAERGCKAVFYIEFVPVTDEARHLAPGDQERGFIRTGIDRLRKGHPEMVFVSFPGDEKSSGGCLAAGRGFFHINSHGGAEPCPFSPYSDINVAETSLKEALNSGLFRALRDNGHLLAEVVQYVGVAFFLGHGIRKTKAGNGDDAPGSPPFRFIIFVSHFWLMTIDITPKNIYKYLFLF